MSQQVMIIIIVIRCNARYDNNNDDDDDNNSNPARCEQKVVMLTMSGPGTFPRVALNYSA